MGGVNAGQVQPFCGEARVKPALGTMAMDEFCATGFGKVRNGGNTFHITQAWHGGDGHAIDAQFAMRCQIPQLCFCRVAARGAVADQANFTAHCCLAGDQITDVAKQAANGAAENVQDAHDAGRLEPTLFHIDDVARENLRGEWNAGGDGAAGITPCE